MLFNEPRKWREGENGKAILVRDGCESAAWKRMPYFSATAGDIQAKPTRVSGGLALLVITGQIVWPSDYILHPVYHRRDDSLTE